MKKNMQLITLLFFVLLLNSCKKTGTLVPPSIRATCKPITESTTLSGNNSTYQYVYGDGGKNHSYKKIYLWCVAVFFGGGRLHNCK